MGRVDIEPLWVLLQTGHRIPAIENLGVAGVRFPNPRLSPSLLLSPTSLLTLLQPQDAIDLTDNDIRVLGNLPLSPRLRSLLLARNRVSSIQSSLPEAVPNLTSLVLTANSLAELADLDVLGGFKRLTHLVLIENPVTRKEVRAALLFCLRKTPSPSGSARQD